MKDPETGSQFPVELQPATMGAQGDAVATFHDQRVFVPFALPGEAVRAVLQRRSGGDLQAGEIEILAPSPDRVAPACRHFGRCGGCKLQHWSAAAYRSWKLDLVRQALRQHGLDLPARHEAVFLPAGTRRRAEFAARKQAGRVALGFQEARGRRIVDQEECPLLSPALARLVAPLRQALEAVLSEGQAVDILATATSTGADLAVSADRPPTQRQRQALAGFAETQGIARVTWRGDLGRNDPGRGDRGGAEPIVMLRVPQIAFGEVIVDLPSPSFLQPSEAGEAALRAALLGHVGKAKRIAELFAGCGTFTFALARLGRVHAVEGSKPSLQALEQAARRAQLADRISLEGRDLERAPLTAPELKPFDTVVFDPPRAGAKAQSEILARSRVPHVVAVSCNPQTFARDARLLADGGLRLAALTLVDQFIWSPHVEIVADFRRGR